MERGINDQEGRTQVETGKDTKCAIYDRLDRIAQSRGFGPAEVIAFMASIGLEYAEPLPKREGISDADKEAWLDGGND